MIWVYILAAVILSWIITPRPKYWGNYIWLLLPIELYGIQLGGAVIKPYMIFGFFIILTNLTTIKFPTLIYFISFLLVLSDCFTGLFLSSIMQHIMVMIIFIIACGYLSAQKGVIDADEIANVSIGTTLGYGIVYSIAYILTYYGIVLPDVYTTDRYTTGIVYYGALTGLDNAIALRLRGFCIDPNGVINPLILGAAFALNNLFYESQKKWKNMLAIIIYFSVVYFSRSRAGMISSLAMVAYLLIMYLKNATNAKQTTLPVLGGIAFITLIMIGNYNSIVKGLKEYFEARSSFTGSAGRYTIWKYNLNYLIDNGYLLTGVGQNKIHDYTLWGKPCHNTWLEWVSGTGVFIGLFMSSIFICSPIRYLRKNKHKGIVYLERIRIIILAYYVLLIAITTVDYIACPTMIIQCIIFLYGTYYSLSESSGNCMNKAAQDSCTI